MIEQKLEELGIKIPEAPKPLAAYIPATIVGNLVYTAGQLPIVESKLIIEGKLGRDLSTDNGIKAAEICAINCLSAIKSAIGNLNKIRRIVKVTVFVNSAEGFTQQPQVANGASELLVNIFGEAGKHVRSAVGVNELPINAPVEIEMIAEIEN
jgi:enamine deaminase RidA (YjgF/YER057c/UK114 family)